MRATDVRPGDRIAGRVVSWLEPSYGGVLIGDNEGLIVDAGYNDDLEVER